MELVTSVDNIRGLYDDYLNHISGKYEAYLNFIKTERDKGEGLSKRMQGILYGNLKETSFLLKDFDDGAYSSGKKIGVFDEISIFDETVFVNGIPTNRAVIFGKQEIESYARSHRVFEHKHSNPFTFNKDGVAIVKVFDFKPEKI